MWGHAGTTEVLEKMGLGPTPQPHPRASGDRQRRTGTLAPFNQSHKMSHDARYGQSSSWHEFEVTRQLLYV